MVFQSRSINLFQGLLSLTIEHHHHLPVQVWFA